MAAARVLKFGQHLKELRIHLCQKSPASQGVRDFIEKQYVTLKQNNPKFPILIRECSGVHPVIYARYEMGQEASQSLANKSEAQVAQTLQSMAAATR